MGCGPQVKMRTIKKLFMEDGKMRLLESTLSEAVTVRPTRKGIFVGCTFVTYEALDELVRVANEDVAA